MIVLAWWAPLWLALGLGAALFLARAELAATLRLSRRAWAVRLGWVGLALVVRLAWLPALGGHAYDGHEAEYYAIFLGERGLVAGDTTLYPAVQALWWGLGHLLPRAPWVPVLVSGTRVKANLRCFAAIRPSHTPRLAHLGCCTAACGQARGDGSLQPELCRVVAPFAGIVRFQLVRVREQFAALF